MAKQAGDPPSLLVCLRVRVRWTRKARAVAAHSVSTTSPQSYVCQRGGAEISIICVRCDARCGVERPDCALAAGEGAPFVTVERHGAIKRSVIQGLHGKAIGACASHAPHIDLRAGDPARHFEAVPAGLRPCNGARQGGDPVREYGIEAGGAAQAMPHRVAR